VVPPLPVEAIPPLLENLTGCSSPAGRTFTPRPTARDLPILAISRGAQALNIARGGTLFQHLPERFGRAIQHRQLGSKSSSTHPVEVAEDSILASAIGRTQLEENSYHHQATSGLGRGVRAVAWAPDGVVEAIEVPRSSFVVGVQWHAESMPPAPARARLFRAFVEVASAAAREAAGARPTELPRAP